MTNEDWTTVKLMAEQVKHTISYAGIQAHIMEKNNNGAIYWIRKIGGKVYVSPSRFYEWIEKEGKI